MKNQRINRALEDTPVGDLRGGLGMDREKVFRRFCFGRGENMGEEIKEPGGNGKVEVSGEIVDLIKGLKSLSDIDGCYFLIQRLKSLNWMIDEIEDEGGRIREITSILDLCFWQRELIDKIESIIEAQDRLIMEMKNIIYKDLELPYEEEYFKADGKKLTALRGLEHLFSGIVTTRDLRAWSTTYGYNFETVKGLLEKKAPETESPQ